MQVCITHIRQQNLNKSNAVFAKKKPLNKIECKMTKEKL
jgi:hypothetical protein